MKRIIVKITVSNRGPAAVTKTIRQGSVVEVTQSGSPYQHAMVVRDYPVTVPAGETITVFAEAECLNRNRSWPAGVPASLTPFRFGGLAYDQEDLWQQFSP